VRWLACVVRPAGRAGPPPDNPGRVCLRPEPGETPEQFARRLYEALPADTGSQPMLVEVFRGESSD
jgi:hypothetical protein